MTTAAMMQAIRRNPLDDSSFINSLNILAEKRLIINYFHVTLTLDPHKRGGIPYKFFKDNTWKCDLEDNIRRIDY